MSDRTNRIFTTEFKERAVLRLEAGEQFSALAGELAIAALDMALASRNPAPATLIHHSDRGVQYASLDYRRRLEAHGIAASMSRVANPAACPDEGRG